MLLREASNSTSYNDDPFHFDIGYDVVDQSQRKSLRDRNDVSRDQSSDIKMSRYVTGAITIISNMGPSREQDQCKIKMHSFGSSVIIDPSRHF